MKKSKVLIELEEWVKKEILFLDGAMGTVIQLHRLQEADFRGERFRESRAPSYRFPSDGPGSRGAV